MSQEDISSAVNSTAENTIASSKALKAAYDLANTAKSAADTAQTTANEAKTSAANAKTAADTYKSEILTTINNPDGGLNLVNNKLSVDFSQMPTDKFEALLKSIRVPIWLEKNTYFYVNGSTGSDTLDEGRGLSSSKPFKTIQACVNYVCDNYNLSRYNAIINVASGSYHENVRLPAYTSAGGSITLIGNSSSNTFITSAESSSTVNVRECEYSVKNFTISWSPPNLLSSNIYTSCIELNDNAMLTLSNCNINVNFTNLTDQVKQYLRWIKIISLNKYSNMSIGSNVRLESIEYPGSFGFTGIILLVSSSLIYSTSTTDESEQMVVSGKYGSFIEVADNSQFSRGSLTLPNIINDNVSGVRYKAYNGGFIKTANGGEEYYPGTIAGTVETASYSWYK